MTTGVIMIQGTTSDAGKSTLVAGLCRLFANKGLSIAPCKPQNMALNSAVTKEGGEIGRAQALQAIAAKTEPHVDFNPILLKPNSDTGAQVIIHGKAITNMEAQIYQDYKKVAMQAVIASHERLTNHYDLVLVEGAGSPAEINLRENDIANMGYAEQVNCPVIIIADIDKGGVFAHLVGTLALLSESEQNRVKGFVINRFRGDIALLQSGLDWLEENTKKPVLGVLPYIHDLVLDAEDAINTINKTDGEQGITIAVLLLPHISNHTDFDPLALNSKIKLVYIKMGQSITGCDLIIVPGSKNVIFDLEYLYQQKWHEQIKRHLRYGGKVIGICGGFQMLGSSINDPHAIESSTQSIEGLGLAEFQTTLEKTKTLREVKTFITPQRLSLKRTKNIEAIEGTAYEIHCGISHGKALDNPFCLIEHATNMTEQSKQPDGFISDDNKIIGTYLHGLFDSPELTQCLLTWIKPDINTHAIDIDKHRDQQVERLAEVCDAHLDIEKILDIAGVKQ